MKTTTTTSPPLRIVDRAADQCNLYLAGHHLPATENDDTTEHTEGGHSAASLRSAKQTRWARSLGKLNPSPSQQLQQQQRPSRSQSAQRARWAQSMAKFTETTEPQTTTTTRAFSRESPLTPESSSSSSSSRISVQNNATVTAETLAHWNTMDRYSESFHTSASCPNGFTSTKKTSSSQKHRWARSLAKFRDANSSGEFSVEKNVKGSHKGRWGRSLAKLAKARQETDSPTTSSTENTEEHNSSAESTLPNTNTDEGTTTTAVVAENRTALPQQQDDEIHKDEKTLIELAKLISIEEEESAATSCTSQTNSKSHGPLNVAVVETEESQEVVLDESQDIALQTALLASQHATVCQQTEEALVDLVKEASRKKHQHERRKERVVQEHVEYQDYVYEQRKNLQQEEEELVQDVIERSLELFKADDDIGDSMGTCDSEEMEIQFDAESTTTEVQ